jgi:glycosyltransferase involved in cell wall biosynthesis
MKPLVSILIPAHNAERVIAYTMQSAIGQTWERKEIIVVDDGSTDQTAEVVRRFVSKNVTIVSADGEGAAAARNRALNLSQGDYIQWLDADDLLSSNKIECQLAALREGDGRRTLISSPWAHFHYRTSRARFVPNSLWHDLTPVEWLLRKMGENLHMQTSTWLTSRELVEAAGPWDTRLHSDDDGEYFCRVLLACEGRTRFVPEAKVFYRLSGTGSLSYIGKSYEKKVSMLLSMKLHIRYLRSLEDSERVRKACLVYLQNWYGYFYQEDIEILSELQRMAAELQGHLEPPQLTRKYAWIKPILGWSAANWVQRVLPEMKASLLKRWDKAMFEIETREPSR